MNDLERLRGLLEHLRNVVIAGGDRESILRCANQAIKIVEPLRMSDEVFLKRAQEENGCIVSALSPKLADSALGVGESFYPESPMTPLGAELGGNNETNPSNCDNRQPPVSDLRTLPSAVRLREIIHSVEKENHFCIGTRGRNLLVAALATAPTSQRVVSTWGASEHLNVLPKAPAPERETIANEKASADRDFFRSIIESLQRYSWLTGGVTATDNGSYILREGAIAAALASFPAPPIAEAGLREAADRLNYYAEFGLNGSADDPLYQAVLRIHNAGFELAHELAKCGHARANYRDPNYVPGKSIESDSSKCEFCMAIAALRAIPGDEADRIRRSGK